MNYSREDFWVTYDGRKIRFRDLSDAHLINIIFHVKQWGCSAEFVEFLTREAHTRGLSEEFINQAQIPHICQGHNMHGVEPGTWAMWDYQKNKVVQISKNKAKYQ